MYSTDLPPLIVSGAERLVTTTPALSPGLPLWPAQTHSGHPALHKPALTHTQALACTVSCDSRQPGRFSFVNPDPHLVNQPRAEKVNKTDIAFSRYPAASGVLSDLKSRLGQKPPKQALISRTAVATASIAPPSPAKRVLAWSECPT